MVYVTHRDSTEVDVVLFAFRGELLFYCKKGAVVGEPFQNKHYV